MIVFRCFRDMVAYGEANVSPENLKDDGTDWTGIEVPKPWGSEREVYKEGAISIWRLVLDAGAETSMHAHPNKETVLAVQSGECLFETYSGESILRAGDMVLIKAGAFHRTKTKDGAVVIEMESPPNKNDLVRIDDKYGRGQGYG